MPPPPGSSRRCRECRLRRVKCGLEQPRCNRCVKRGSACSGPRPSDDAKIFIRRDMSNVQEISDRDMLNLEIRNQNNSTSTQCRRSVQAACRINKPVDHLSPLSTISSVGVSTGLYRSVVDDFWILSCDPANNSARQAVEASMSYCGQVILPLAFRNRALDAAIFTAATMYIGQVRGDVNLRRLAMDAYSTALCRFRSELTKAFESKPEQRYPKDVVMAILMSLLLLEWLAHGPNGEGFRRHIQGAFAIVKLSGPQSFQPPVARQVYTTIRIIALNQAYKTRKAMFLAADHWENIPYQNSTKEPRHLLLDIISHIPGLLERSDQIKCLSRTKGDNVEDQRHSAQSSVIEYLRDCDCLIQKLRNWLKCLEESEKKPLWWYSRNSEVGSTSQQSSLIHFSTPKVAGLLIHYWTGYLQLCTAILEVRDLFCHDTLFAAHCKILGADSPSMSMDMDRPSQVALRVCQTVVYLGSSLEGCTIAYSAVELAEEYFNHLLATKWRSDWGNSHDREQYYERARIGLECTKLGFEKLSSALQNSQ